MLLVLMVRCLVNCVEGAGGGGGGGGEGLNTCCMVSDAVFVANRKYVAYISTPG